MKRISNVFIVILAALMLTACVSTKHFITPINKNIVGNLHVVDISVITKSKPLARKLKNAVLKETVKRLKGSHEVKLKIDVVDWRPAYNFKSVKTGNRRTTLGIEVTVLDAKTNAIVGKYKTGAFKGSDNYETRSGKNVNTHIIDTTAYFVAWQLEK